MAENPRIDDLRRRIQKDPASIAFAQLAEELRRAGDFKGAVDVCRAGLAKHPGYVSARVTLGRALIELSDLDAAEAELGLVLKSAPENLSAIRGRADIFRRRGNLGDALTQYRLALGLARNDPDLERTVEDLERQVGPEVAAPRIERVVPKATPTPARVTPAKATPPKVTPATIARPVAARTPVPVPPPPRPVVPEPPKPDPIRERALLTIAALEHFLDAVHVLRTEQRA